MHAVALQVCIYVPPLVAGGLKEIVPHLSSVISNGATSIYAQYNEVQKYKLVIGVRNTIINNSASSKSIYKPDQQINSRYKACTQKMAKYGQIGVKIDLSILGILFAVCWRPP